MALKVVTNYQPKINLKVTTKPVNYVTPKQPKLQPAKSPMPKVYNPQPKTVNPQKTANAVVLQQQQQANWAQEQATRLRLEADAREVARVAEIKRLRDAKNIEIAGNKQDWKGKLTFQSDFKARNARETATKYIQYNQDVVLPNLLARQRQYERDAGKKYQEAVDRIQNAKTEEEYNAIVAEFTAWETRVVDALNRDITEYTTEQDNLSSYAGTPISSFTGNALGTSKRIGEKIRDTGWNVLKKGTEIFERGVNTTKNFVNPNNLRLYYGGEEKKGGITGQGSNPISTAVDQLKKSYNASEDQRILGFSKEDEANRLAGGKPFQYKDFKTGEIKTGYTKPATGFNKLRIKYGDDIVNFGADPMNFLPNGWLGKGAKAIKADKALAKVSKVGTKFADFAYKQAGKSNALSDYLITRQARKGMKEDSWTKWLGSPKGEYNKAKYPDFYDNRIPAYKGAIDNAWEQTRKFKDEKINPHWNKFRDAQAGKAKHLQDWSGSYKKLEDYDTKWTSSLKNLAEHNPDKADALQKYMSTIRQVDDKLPYTLKKADSFDGIADVASKLSEKERRKVMVRAWRMRKTFDKLYDDDISRIKKQIDAIGDNPSTKAKERLAELKKELYKKKQGYFSKTEVKSPVTKLGKPKGESFSPYYRKQQKTWAHQSPKAFADSQSKRVWSQLIQEDPSLSKMFDESKRINYKIQDSYKRATGADASPFLKNKYKEGKDAIFKKNIDKVTTPFEKLTGNKLIAPTPTKAERFEKGLNKAGKMSPMRAWTKSVLTLNPAWYINNLGTNLPFTASAGGLSAYKEVFKMIKSPKYRRAVTANLPEGVTGAMKDFAGGGKSGRFTSLATDEIPRIASFLAQKAKGKTDDEALKIVNDWFFDYSVRNVERPLKAVSPFYKWQTGLMGLSAKMPFKYPRSAKGYNSFYQQFFDRPNKALPDQTQTYKDPDTGEETTFNPKEAYKGKMFIGNDKDGNPKFMNTPFFAMNPNSMTDFSINPVLSLGQDLATGSDRFGRNNTDKSALRLLADKFPQAKLANAYKERNIKQSKYWFTEQGSSKFKQGYDPSKPNYDKYLDKRETFNATRNSFFGKPAVTTYDKKAYDEKFRVSKFNKDFFAKNWDDRLQELQDEAGGKYFDFNDTKNPYNIVKAEQEALAKKYGLDLQKDMYDNYWSKYDTATTKRTKQLKQDAREFTGDFWQGYNALPAGSRTQASEKRPYLIKKYREWADNDSFAENGYRRLPKFSVYDGQKDTGRDEAKNLVTLKNEQARSEARRAEGKRKYQRYLEYQKATKTGDWSWFEKNGGGSAKATAYKTAKTSGDWTAYNKAYGDTRKGTPFTYDGKFFKTQESMDKYKTGSLWREYYSLKTIADKQAFLEKHPELKQFDQPETQEEWDAVKALLKKQRNEKLAGVSGFTASRANMKKRIESTLPSGFGGKRRLKYKF